MTELEKIAYAKTFIDKLANGINPIDNSVIPDDDVVNNVRLSRCFFYVSDILRQVIDNGGITAPPVQHVEKKGRKQAYFLSPEQAEKFEYSDTPITATEVINRIIAVGPQEGVKRFPKRNLMKWLFCLGFIEEIEIDNIKRKSPTDAGKEIGISLEERWGQYGSYYVILYNRDAQQFILDNIEAILAFDNGTYKEKMNIENQGKAWNNEQDEKLVALFKNGFTVREIAHLLRRGEHSIRLRLQHNGIDADVIAKAINSSAEPQLPSQTGAVEGGMAKAEKTCQSCRFARSGECFPQKEICADYEKAFDVPEDEREAWPEMGDASYFRQNGRHR